MSTTSSGAVSRRQGRMRKRPMQWYKVDVHIHTPASKDFEEPNVGYLDILREASRKGMDIIAITDHNTVAGISAIRREIEQLTMLERLQRIHPEEKERLEEYRRLGDALLVLPGFEVTATFGFHILGIFPPETSVRELEHLLLQMHIPSDKLDWGSTEVGATVDVLTAYRLIDEAGGLVIAAHANSSHGVAMRGLPFGGQTKIAWTQDEHLHALEVTDLESNRRNATARFFSGSKPEYPRRMHCIQGSDAHRLTGDPEDRSRLGVGERATEILLPEASFEALYEVFTGTDFARTRPYRPSTKEPFDHVQAAREQGASIVQSFHESMTRKGGRLHAVLCDIVAFANTRGGTIYIGANTNPKTPPVGVPNVEEAIAALRQEIAEKITPPLDVGIDHLESLGKHIVRINVPEGPDKPYAMEQSKIYVRQESETNLAVRDEIIQLVRRRLEEAVAPAASPPEEAVAREPAPESPAEDALVDAPHTGVEIVSVAERKGTRYYTLRDLRNGNTVQNVTRSSARKLWRYAISQHEDAPLDPSQVTWRGGLGLWKKTGRQGRYHFDLVQRDRDGDVHIYYGVSEDGIHGPWQELVETGGE